MCVKNRLKILNCFWKNKNIQITSGGGGFFWLTLPLFIAIIRGDHVGISENHLGLRKWYDVAAKNEVFVWYV